MKFLTSLIFGIILTSFFVGFPNIKIFSLPFTFLCIILGISINFLTGFAIATIAFWVEDANPFHWIYDKIIFILGGLMFPLEILLEYLQKVALNLPTAYFLYFPSKLFVNFSFIFFLEILFKQVIIILLLICLVSLLLKIGFKKVSINGG